MAGELDFAGEGGDDSLFGLLDQQFNQVQAQDQQAEAADDKAAATDQPAPPDPSQQMGPPSPGVMAGAAPIMPGGPSPQLGPAGGPADQIVPGPNVGGPQPANQPGGPAPLYPEPQAGEVQQNATQGENDLRKAESLQEKAKQEQAQANVDYAKATEPEMNMQVEAAQREVKARDIVQQWATAQTNQIAANTQSDLQRQEAMLAEKPNDWWGNHSTPQKIAAVVGMIGAGFSGRSASGFMDNLVNKDVADYNRRAGVLNNIQGLHRSQERQFQNAYQNQDEMIKTRSISVYNYALKSLQQKRNATQSKFQQANYDQAIADLQTKLADDVQALNKDKMVKLIEEQKMKLQWAQLAQRREEEKSRVAAKDTDNSVYYEDLEQTIPGGPQGVDPRVNTVVKKKWSVYSNGIENGDKILEGFDQVDRGEMSFADAKVQLAPYISSMFSISRDLAGAGAKLEGPEEALVKDMSIGWKDYLEHKITGVQMAEKVRAVQRMLAHRADRVATENTKGLRPKANSAVGRTLAQESQEQETSTLEKAVLQQALAANKTDQQKALVMQRLAGEGNNAARKMLGAKKKSHWYNPEHWIDWSNKEAPAE